MRSVLVRRSLQFKISKMLKYILNFSVFYTLTYIKLKFIE
jgi:hypothetical protein